MHFQKAPHEEIKTVSCVRGRVHDVIIDLRPSSPTYKQHVSQELSEENGTMIYIPKGFAHGYVTLEDNCAVTYLMSQFHYPEEAGGVRYDDPAFGITWPVSISLIADKDRLYADLAE